MKTWPRWCGIKSRPHESMRSGQERNERQHFQREPRASRPTAALVVRTSRLGDLTGSILTVLSCPPPFYILPTTGILNGVNRARCQTCRIWNKKSPVDLASSDTQHRSQSLTKLAIGKISPKEFWRRRFAIPLHVLLQRPPYHPFPVIHLIVLTFNLASHLISSHLTTNQSDRAHRARKSQIWASMQDRAVKLAAMTYMDSTKAVRLALSIVIFFFLL